MSASLRVLVTMLFGVSIASALAGCASFHGALASKDWPAATKVCHARVESERAMCLRILGAAQWGTGARAAAADTWLGAGLSEDEATFLAHRAREQGERGIAESLLRSANVPCARGFRYTSLKNIAGGRPSDSIAGYQACGLSLEQARNELVLDYRRLLFPEILRNFGFEEGVLEHGWRLSRDGQFLFRRAAFHGHEIIDLASGKYVPLSREVYEMFDATCFSNEECKVNKFQELKAVVHGTHRSAKTAKSLHSSSPKKVQGA